MGQSSKAPLYVASAAAGAVLAVIAGIVAFVLVVMMMVTNAAKVGGQGGQSSCLVNFTGGQYANPLVATVTSGFGPRPNPFGPGVIPAGFTSEKPLIFHDGTDLAGVPQGTPFYAAAAGTVVASYGPNSIDGPGDGANGIIIDIGGGVQMRYWHAVDGSSKVKRGDVVQAGQELAAVGMSGVATGVHVHFQVRVGTEYVDAQKWMADKGITLGVGTADQKAQKDQNPATPGTGDGRSVQEMTVVSSNGGQIKLDANQVRNATTIRDVGLQVGASTQDIKIALMTGLQESKLKNLSNTSAYPESGALTTEGDGRDNDSVGIFQQRPQSGWGTVAQLMDPVYAAKAFFGGKTGPNKGSPRGLFDIPGYAGLPLGAAAQAVQVSAFPFAYDQWSATADAILAQLGGTVPNQCDPNAGNPDATKTGNVDQARTKIIAAAKSGLGGTYLWGGNQFKSWDCSGYVKWVYEQAGVALPRTEQWSVGTKTLTPQPGDLVVQLPDGKGGWSHVGIYAGNGQMYSALNPTEGTLMHPVDWNPGSEYFTLLEP